MTRSTIRCILLGLALVSCTHEPPLDDLDSLTLTDDVRWSCDEWSPAEPNRTWVLMDLYYGPSPETGPASEHLDRVTLADAVIIHEFNIAMIRAVLRPESLSIAAPLWATGVPDSESFPIDVTLWWHDDDAVAAVAEVVSRDGVVTGINYLGAASMIGDSIALVSARISDEAVPALRADPNVTRVAAPGAIWCGS